MSRSIGLQSLAASVPERILTNDRWRETYSQLIVGGGKRSREAPTEDDSSEAASLHRQWAPYLDDPFRGARERRVLPAGGTALDLESRAATEALAVADLEPRDVDLLICTSWLPDHHGIGNATYLARELGLKGAAWNIESAGASALIALQTACSLVATGQYRKALVVTSCSHSRAASEATPGAWQLGDAATAMVVGEATDPNGYLGGHSIHTGGTQASCTHRLVADPEGRLAYSLTSAGGATEALAEATEQTLVSCVDRALAKAGLVLDDVDHFIFNTPNVCQASFCARALGIDARRAPSVYPLYADVGPALLALNLLHAAHWRQFQPGQPVLLYATDSAANGSAAIVRWGEVALGELPAGATLERVESLEAETLALYRLRRLEAEVVEPADVLGDADQRLRRLVAGYATLAIDEPGIMTLFAEDSEAAPENLLPEILERSRRFISTLERQVTALFRQQGPPSRIDPTVAALSLLGIVHWGVSSYRTEKRLSRDEAIEQVTRLALHGLTSQPPQPPVWPASDPLTA